MVSLIAGIHRTAADGIDNGVAPKHQNTVTVHLKSKQLLHYDFSQQMLPGRFVFGCATTGSRWHAWAVTRQIRHFGSFGSGPMWHPKRWRGLLRIYSSVSRPTVNIVLPSVGELLVTTSRPIGALIFQKTMNRVSPQSRELKRGTPSLKMQCPFRRASIFHEESSSGRCIR